METIVINLGGEDYSVQYYINKYDKIEIDSVQCFGCIERINSLDYETIEEIEEEILKYYGIK